MNYTAAREQVNAYVAFDADPALTETQIRIVMSAAATTDADGIEPSEDGWTPTYSRAGCWRAVARAAEMKIGAAANRFDFTTDGQTFRRSQIIDHLEAVAAMAKRKLAASLPPAD